jgi:hypothetical protein
MTPVGEVVQAFMFNCLRGGRRFAHARRVQDDQALAVILGMKKGRLCGEDTLYRMMEKVPLSRPARGLRGVNVIFTQPRAAAFVADWDSTVNTRYGKQEEVARGYNLHKP